MCHFLEQNTDLLPCFQDVVNYKMYNWLKKQLFERKKNTTLLMGPSILKHILTSESLKWEQAYVLQWKKFMIIMLVPI